MHLHRYWTVSLCLALGCSGVAPAPKLEAAIGDITLEVPPPPDAGTDAGLPTPDAGTFDAGAPDAGQPEPDAGAPVCGGLQLEPTDGGCAACQATNCCVTMSACQQDAQCRQLYACQRACTTNACLTTCRNQFPGGVWLVSGLIICASANCSAACAIPARTCGGIGLTTTSCNSCVQQNCCAESTACATNDSCDAFIYQCLDHNSCGSTTDACGTACRAKHDAGMGSFDTLRSCALTNCPTQCAGL